MKFILSAPSKASWPQDDLKEICIIGKSNVGKSTFINTLGDNKKLARVSSTPGCTRFLNFFDVDKKFRIVDAPGYGYAKTSLHKNKDFEKMMEEYVFERENTVLFILLVDSRHYPSVEDIESYELLKEANKNILILATKKDKLNQSMMVKAKKNIKQAFGDEKNYFFISKDDKKQFENIIRIINKYI